MNILFVLFLTFAKIGLFTFGGGYSHDFHKLKTTV